MQTILDSIIKIWDGFILPFPVAKTLPNLHLYVKDGFTARAIISVHKFDEDWEIMTDVPIEHIPMENLYKLEWLFEAPVIVAAEYNNKHVWMNVSSIYCLAAKHSGKKHCDFTHDGIVYIPKEHFNHLYKEDKNEPQTKMDRRN